MDKIQYIEKDIRSLTIQGATNIALAVLEGIKIGIQNGLDAVELENIGRKLAYIRPTEPLAQNAIRFIFRQKNQEHRFYTGQIGKYQSLIISAKASMAQNAIPFIKDGGTYLTHCHSSTVVSIFRKAREKGLKFQVFATETRPRFQGRITVKELLDAGVENVTMVIDDAASSILLSDDKKIDGVFIGADLMGEKGFINKVGSLGIAYAAGKAGIPVYTLSILLKFDPRPYTGRLLEEREGAEIWKEAPPNLAFYAPAFDFIPYDTGVKVVAETGIIENNLADEAYRIYPFLKNS